MAGRLALLAVLVAALAAAPANAKPKAKAKPKPAVAKYVDTRIGTDEGAPDFGTGGGAGATFPGATAPFGMLQLSPDTHPGVRNYSGGYTHSDKLIKGFSLTHMSGTGCANLADVPILPTTRPVSASPSSLLSYDVDPRYVAPFTHDGEVARPGDYRVRLHPGRAEIGAELTASARAGAMRMTFPAGSRGSVLVNAGGSMMGNDDATLHVDPVRREISGTVSSGAFCSAYNKYRVFFVARFDRAFAASGTWQRQLLRPGASDATDAALRPQLSLVTHQYKRVAGLPDALPGNPSTGAQAGAYATFDTGSERSVVARVAISSVSVDGARANLDRGAAKPFDAMRAAARKTWEKQLGAIRVGGGTVAQRKLFYTSLYHSLLMPNLFSDVDGRYRGMDDRIHRAAGFAKYANISGWDTYRAQLPLMAMLAPRVTSDLVASMLADYRESGHLPKWSLREGQTNVMVGDPADLLIAGAWAYGARRFDARAALRAMVDGATDGGTSPNGGYVQRAGLADYLRLGYVGHERNTSTIIQTVLPDLAWGSAATTLEYSLADFGIARLAAAVGDRETCAAFARRSANWRNVFDHRQGGIRPRLATTGGFVPAARWSEDGFVEGSAEQYTWFVPHDVAGLAGELGGREVALRRLDRFFTNLNAGGRSEYAFLGNEPSLHTPYLYNWLGAPARGAGVVRRALLGLYKPTPGGFPGNDDGGSMSAWWVFNALGFHPSVPGTGVLTLGSPLFPRADIRLARGTLKIRAPRAAAGRPYVRSVKRGKKRLGRNWVSWRSIERGGSLRFDLSADPAQRWATGPQAAPPSYAPGRACGS